MALVQRHLTDDDWLDLERRYFKKENPPRLMVFAVPWVCLGLPDDVLRRAFALNPRALQVLWLLTRRGFARRHREAFAALHRA